LLTGTAFSAEKEKQHMAKKENKGGLLTDDQVERDNLVKGHGDEKNHSYIGMQDTGDSGVREKGSKVQQRDGLPEEEDPEEEA
jgi:hypothetical protein